GRHGWRAESDSSCSPTPAGGTAGQVEGNGRNPDTTATRAGGRRPSRASRALVASSGRRTHSPRGDPERAIPRGRADTRRCVVPRDPGRERPRVSRDPILGNGPRSSRAAPPSIRPWSRRRKTFGAFSDALGFRYASGPERRGTGGVI